MSRIVTPQDFKEFRRKHELSQTELADLLSVSIQAIEDWEVGGRKPHIYTDMALDFAARAICAKRRLRLMEEGSIGVGVNWIDVTEVSMDDLRSQIKEFEGLIAKCRLE